MLLLNQVKNLHNKLHIQDKNKLKLNLLIKMMIIKNQIKIKNNMNNKQILVNFYKLNKNQN